MLSKFVQAKSTEIARLVMLDEVDRLPAVYAGHRPSFVGALRDHGPGAVIAEYKRASPSRGVINTDLSCHDVTTAYARAGAACVSVLTENTYFQGELDYLTQAQSAGLPLLRKDFILAPLQIVHTASTPASAVLLIARMVDLVRLKELLGLCASHGLEAVTEIFDKEDLDKARQAKATVLQVNNRDLETLEVDLETSHTLIQEKAAEELWISASGISSPAQMQELTAKGFDALLIGSSCMQAKDPGQALKTLLGSPG